MNLTITQDNTRTETINSSIIDKLYEIAFAASSDPNSTVSLTGRLESPKGYKYKINWLNTEFSPDLTITVPSNGLYIAFYDSAVENVLKTSIGDGEGISVLSIHDLLDLKDLNLINNSDITDFREGILFDHNPIATSMGFINGSPNLDVVGIPPNMVKWTPYITNNCSPSKIVISNWGNWICPELVLSGNSLCGRKHDLCTLNSDNSLSTVTSINLPEGVDFPSGHMMFGGFYNSTINTVNIPTTVTRLNSFLWSDIQTLTFTQESTLTSIEEYCFYECSNLVFNVANLPLTITTIGNNAFRSCSNVTGVLDLHNLTSLGQYSFYASRVKGATDLGSITEIPLNCFLYSTLLSITLPSTCTTIKSRGLSDMTSLTTVSGGSGLTTIEDYAFYNDTNLTSVAGLSNVTSIGEAAFLKCSSLSSVGNLSNVLSIGTNSFESCSSLTGPLSFPNVRNTLGNWAFGNTNITSLDFTGSTFTAVGMSCFRNCSNLTKLILPTTVRTLNNEWAVGISRTLWIEGLDNVDSRLTANWTLRSPIIQNPIKDSMTTEGIIATFNDGSTTLHSLYEPSKINTGLGTHLSNGYWQTEFCYLNTANSVNINLLYYRDIEHFGSLTFYHTNISNLVINNTTPPTLTLNTDSGLVSLDYYIYWGNSIFGTGNDSNTKATIGTLWVPDSAVATYQADPLYSSLTIKGINTKTNGVDYDLPRYADYAAWKAAEEAAVAQGGHAPLGLIEAWM